MPLTSPFGNGPRNLQPPETGISTLAQTVAPVKLPNVPVPSPQPSPADFGDYSAPQQQAAPVQGNTADYGDYASPDLGDYSAPPAAAGPVQGPPQMVGSAGRIRRNADGSYDFKTGDTWGKPPKVVQETFEKMAEGLDLGQHFASHDVPRIAGAVVGEIAGARTGIPGAATVGAGLGSATVGYIADMAQEVAKIKDPNTRSKLSKGVQDFVTGMAGSMLPGAMSKGLAGQAARWEGQAAVDPVVQEGAMVLSDRANKRIADAGSIQNPDGSPMTLMRQQANLENPELQAGFAKVAQNPAQSQVVAQIKAQQRNAVQGSFDSAVSDLKKPLEDFVAAKPSRTLDFHEFLTDYSRTLEDGIAGYHREASELAGQRLFSVEPLLDKLRNKIQSVVRQDGLFTANGELNGRNYNDLKAANLIDDDAKPLIREYLGLYSKTRRQFGGTIVGNRSMPQYVEPFGDPTTGGFTERPVDTQVQMPFMSPGAPPKFGMTGTTSSLPPGSAGAAPELQMEMVHPGSSPGALGSEVQTPTGIQPGLSGGSWQQPGGPRRELGPNDSSGVGTKGLTYDELNKLRKDWQDRAGFQQRGDRSQSQKAYGDLSHDARQIFADAGSEIFSPTAPEKATWLQVYNKEYSTKIEKIMAAQKLVEHMPSNAAAALVNPKNPKQLENVLPLLTDPQRQYLAGGYLDHLVENASDREMGGLSSDNVFKQWKSTDPKVKSMLFGGQEKKIDAMINTARVIENKAGATYDPRDDGRVRDFLSLLYGSSGFSFRGGMRFIGNMFKRNQTAGDYIIAKGAEVLMPPTTNYAGRAAIAKRAAQVISSLPAKAAAQTVSRQKGKDTLPDLLDPLLSGSSFDSGKATLKQMEQY